MTKWLGDPDRWSGRLLDGALNLHNFPILQGLRGIAHELRHPGFAHEAMIELATAQVAIELARCAAIALDESAPGGLAPWRLRLIDDRMRDERSPPSISELANLCGLSPRQLARAFRQSRGCSLGQYVAQARVDSAKRLLATDRSIKAIAGMLGFTTPASFTYAFRRSSGASPREFRSRSGRNPAVTSTSE